MAVCDIVKMGAPRLFEASEKIREFNTPELQQLIINLRDTLKHYHGAGLAAPQIDHNVQVVMIGFEHNERYPDEAPIPELLLINPQITVIGEQKVGAMEGCLSIPEMRGWVERDEKIKYHYQDVNGEYQSAIAEGFLARVIQHECDHLQGILYPSRITDFKRFGFKAELEA